MAKYFLGFFSCMLCLSLGIFILNQVNPDAKLKLAKIISPNSSHKNSAPTTSSTDLKNSDTSKEKTLQPELSAKNSKTEKIQDTKESDSTSKESEKTQAKTSQPKTSDESDFKIASDPAPDLKKEKSETKSADSELGERFHPDMNEEETSTPFESSKDDSLHLKKFYANYIQPWVQKIFSNEEVEVDLQKESPNPETSQEKSQEIAQSRPKHEADHENDKKTGLEKARLDKNLSEKNIKSEPKDDNDLEVLASPPAGWAVQVASHQTQKEAQITTHKLESSHHPHFTYKTKIDGNTWYRVNVGPFKSPGKATAYKRSRSLGRSFKGAFVKKL